MLTRVDLHNYQVDAVNHILTHWRSALFMDMGTGKTASVLTAIADLFNFCLIYGVLIVAPRRVAETVWKQEAEIWEQTAHLRVNILRGTNKGTLVRNLQTPHHVWVINYEALPWLFTRLNQVFLRRGRPLPFNMIVFDELTRVKNSEGTRIKPWFTPNSKGYRMIDHFPLRVGLTGTPTPNGYWDLFGQMLALDDGARLGTEQTDYQSWYFHQDFHTRKRVPMKGAREKIQGKIADITFSIQADRYLDLPPYIYNDVIVDLPAKARAIYDSLETEMFADIGDTQLSITNMAALTTKCRQVANGAVIDTEDARKVHNVHDAKLEALDDIMEEAAGQAIFCAYVYVADMKRIKARYDGKYSVAFIGPGVSDTAALEIINEWNRGTYDLLLAHPKSAGHGLNIQFGGHQLAFFGQDYNLEEYLQTCARLRRQGQPSPYVIIHRIMARDTVDLVVKGVLDDKEVDQQRLRNALEALENEDGDRQRLRESLESLEGNEDDQQRLQAALEAYKQRKLGARVAA